MSTRFQRQNQTKSKKKFRTNKSSSSKEILNSIENALSDKIDEIIQNIEFNIRKFIYSKTIYQENAMIILIITDDYRNELIFHNLNSKDIAAVFVLYQLMFDNKKNFFYKQISLILIFKTIVFVKQNEFFF